MIYLDSSAIKDWLTCRELYRLKWVENLASAKPAIHREFGIALHSAVEDFWKGLPYEAALATLMKHLDSVDLELSPPDDRKKWDEMTGYAPDLLECYYNSVSYDPDGLIAIEGEWTHKHTDDVVLCGRMDRLMRGPHLVDLKTASKIGKTWKSDYRAQMLRDFGLQLYDWKLCQDGKTPTMVSLEVLIKPYKGSSPEYVWMDFPEMVTEAYRKRFDQQLCHVVGEIADYHENWLPSSPWPMGEVSKACCHKYGQCEFFKACTFGWTPKLREQFTTRKEHLKARPE